MDNLRIENVQQLPVNNSEKADQRGSKGFGEIMEGAINKVNGLDKDANRSIIDLLQGKTDIHETMIALQKADVSMRLLLAIRNKVLNAYTEIMHMQF